MEWIAERAAKVPEIVDRALQKADMSMADADRIRAAVAGSKAIAWGSDCFAGACCPLRVAGFERAHGFWGAWNVTGGHAFERAYDLAMNHEVLRGPGMIGIRPRVS